MVKNKILPFNIVLIVVAVALIAFGVMLLNRSLYYVATASRPKRK